MAVAMTASQAQEPAEGRVSSRATFESLNPATGQPIATFPIHQRADADVAVSRARDDAGARGRDAGARDDAGAGWSGSRPAVTSRERSPGEVR
jgi:acyl-CoA reductase-like NAD-dependent aldehyde dehydrogenase